jgi:hypothetical protein
MDGVNVPYNNEVELMEYVGPTYKYKYWIWLAKYLLSMWRYGICENYNQMKETNQNKGQYMYIYICDGRPKASKMLQGL